MSLQLVIGRHHRRHTHALLFGAQPYGRQACAGRADPGLRFAVVLPVMLAYAFVSNLTYALVGALLRDWLAGPAGSGQRLLVFNRLMALVLVVTALWMLFL